MSSWGYFSVIVSYFDVNLLRLWHLVISWDTYEWEQRDRLDDYRIKCTKSSHMRWNDWGWRGEDMMMLFTCSAIQRRFYHVISFYSWWLNASFHISRSVASHHSKNNSLICQIRSAWCHWLNARLEEEWHGLELEFTLWILLEISFTFFYGFLNYS